MDCCRSLYGTTPADSLIYLKLQWCSHTELLWTTTSTGCIKHTDRYPTFISTDTCIKSHMRLQCWFHSAVQHQGLIPLLRCPVGVVIFIYIYIFPNLLPLPLFKETRLDIQVFYSICGSDHPSRRSITLPAAFINDLVSQPALGCSRLSRMIDH